MKRKTKHAVIVNGMQMSLLAACREAGYSYDSLYEYMRHHNISAQEAFDRYVDNRTKKPKAWTQAELDTMKALAEAGYSSTTAAQLLNRPILGLRKKALETGVHFHSVRQLTEEEKDWLQKNFGTMTYNSMSKVLGVDIRTLNYWGKRLGLTKPSKTNKTVNVVKMLAGKLTDEEIGGIAKTSVHVVRTVAYENRISLACPEKSGRHPWTPEEDEILKTFYPKEGYKNLSKRLGGKRSPGTVRTRLGVLGLR